MPVPNEKKLHSTLIQEAPLNDPLRDCLLSVQGLLDIRQPEASIQVLYDAFPEVKPTDLDIITAIDQYLTGFTVLHYFIPRDEMESISDAGVSAAHIYLMEAQRLLGSLFPAGSPFWRMYYQRYSAAMGQQISVLSSVRGVASDEVHSLQQKLTLLLLPLDVLHSLSKESDSVLYEILLQSYKWLLTGRFVNLLNAGAQPHISFDHALRLARPLPLPAYHRFLIQQIKSMTDTNHMAQS